jgi:hypothetical protein
MSGAYDPVLEPLRATVKTALNGQIADDDKNNNKYRYEGKEDDRPFFWVRRVFSSYTQPATSCAMLIHWQTCSASH